MVNIGDSRAIISTEDGKLAYNLSRDHKPTDPKEIKRIMQNGGKIYRTEMTKIEGNNKTARQLSPRFNPTSTTTS